MKYQRRKYLDQVIQTLKSEKLVLILGTRQVGKTTLLSILAEQLPGKQYFHSFEDEYFQIQFQNKNDFINYFSLSLGVDFFQEGIFFIDEFQYVQKGEQILKSLYDDPLIRLKFVVTGSGLWTYSKDNVGTLVGRGTEILMYPLDFFEFLEFRGVTVGTLDNPESITKNISNFLFPYYQEYLTFGGYPKVVLARTKAQKIQELEKIVNRYIERDIVYFLNEGETVSFKKFFLFLTSQIGNLVKKEALGEFLSLKVSVIEKYLYLLEKTMFLSRVYPFFTDKTKELSSLPKMYFGDVGVVNYLQKSFDFKENNGKIVENFLFNELQKNKSFQNDEIKTYKKITKSEIDFIYDGFDSCIPIEVKAGERKSIPKVFFQFEEQYQQKTTCFLFTTQSTFERRKVYKKDVYFLPNWYLGKWMDNKKKAR